MSATYEQKAGVSLEKLGLMTAVSQLDQAAQRAAAETWSYSHFLGYLLEGELVFRHQRTVKLNLQFARLPYIKRIEDFDFPSQPSIDKRLVEELFTLRLLADGRNVVLLGPPGVGKTHLAIALAVATAETGHRVYFTTAIEMARRLAKALSENRLKRELQNLTRPRLLVIDEVGYLTLDSVSGQSPLSGDLRALRKKPAHRLDLQQGLRGLGRGFRRRSGPGLGRPRSPASPFHGHQHPRREPPAEREASGRLLVHRPIARR